MSDWVLAYDASGTVVSADSSFVNLTGAMLLSISVIGTGLEGAQPPPAGIFILTADTNSAVSIGYKEIQDMRSPALFVGSVSVVADGVTGNKNVIPGLSIVFNANLTPGIISEVGVGCYWDTTLGGIWQRLTSLGLGAPGVTGSDRVLTLKNMTGNDQSNCQVVVTNGVRVANITGFSCPFFAFRQTGLLNATPDADANGQAVTFVNLNTTTTPATIDIKVAGTSIDVYDVTHGALIPNGEGLWCDETTVYMFADGTKYQGCEFLLSEDIVEGNSAQIFVSDGGAQVELYDADNGEYVTGATGVNLTATGCGVGVVPNGLTAQFIMRLNPAAGLTVDLNQRQFSIKVISVGI